MRIALIVPQVSILDEKKLEEYRWSEMQEFKARERLWSCMHLGLLTVAAMIPEKHEITYIDLNYKDMPLQNKFDMAFLSPTTPQAYSAYEIADVLRKKGTKIVFGGVHTTLLPNEAKKHADVIFIGESEETMPEFWSDLESGRLKTEYRSSNNIDLSKSPVPRYELAKDYPYKTIPIQTSRGCPHQCEFCVSSEIYGKRCRRKKVEQIEAEIKKITSIWKNPYIFFTDDNMFINDRKAIEILSMLKKYHLSWYAFTDAHIAFKNNILRNMKEAGCRQLLIGFESLDEDNLLQINKSGWKREKKTYYNQIINRIQSYGIGVVGSFMLGFENDTEVTFQQIYDFIYNTDLFATNVTILTPFPGTKLYKRYQEANLLLTQNWNKYNGFELTFYPNKMSPFEFESNFVELYKKINSDERINRMLMNFKNKFLQQEINN